MRAAVRPVTTRPPREACRSNVVPLPGALRTSSRPPSAASRSAIPWSPEPRSAASGSKPFPSSTTSNVSDPFDWASRTVAVRRVRVLRDVLQRLQAGEVHGGLRLCGVATDPVRFDLHGDRGLPGLGTQCGGETLDPRAGEDRCRGRDRGGSRARRSPRPSPRPPSSRRRPRRSASSARPGPASPRGRRVAAAPRRGCSAPASGRARPARRRSADASREGRRRAPHSGARAPPEQPRRRRVAPAQRPSPRSPATRYGSRRAGPLDDGPRTRGPFDTGAASPSGHDAIGAIRSPVRSSIEIRSAPMPSPRTRASRGSTSSTEYVSARRSENPDSTSYGVARSPYTIRLAKCCARRRSGWKSRATIAAATADRNALPLLPTRVPIPTTIAT